jgi:hypothetical protein
MNSSFKLVKWLHLLILIIYLWCINSFHSINPKKRNKMKMDYLQSSRDQAPTVYIFRESRAKRMTSLHVSNQHVCLSLRNLFKKTSWTKIYQLLFRAPPFNKWGVIEHTLSPCSAELISTAYQPWNSVFLSQQISHNRLISQKKNSLLNRDCGIIIAKMKLRSTFLRSQANQVKF